MEEGVCDKQSRKLRITKEEPAMKQEAQSHNHIRTELSHNLNELLNRFIFKYSKNIEPVYILILLL